MQRQQLLYDIAKTREFKHDVLPGGFGLSSSPSTPTLGYVLPDGKIALINVFVGKHSPLRIMDPQTGNVEHKAIEDDAVYRSVFGLIAPDKPALFLLANDFSNKVIAAKVLNASLTQVEYTLPVGMINLLKVDEDHCLGLKRGEIVIYDLKTKIYKPLFEDKYGNNFFYYTDFCQLFKIGPHQYAAVTRSDHSNILTFSLVQGLRSFKVNEKDQVFPFQYCFALKEYPASAKLYSSADTEILGICSLNKGLFASLHINDNRTGRETSCSVMIWDSSVHLVKSIELSTLISKIEVCPDNKTLIGFGSYSGQCNDIYLIDSTTGAIQTIPVAREVYSILITNDNSLLVEFSNKVVQLKISRAPCGKYELDNPYLLKDSMEFERFQKIYNSATPKHLAFLQGKRSDSEVKVETQNCAKKPR